MTASGSYTVLRYLPNRARDEPRNIGIILASDSSGDLLVRMTSQPQDTPLSRDQRKALLGFASGLQDQLRSQLSGQPPEAFLKSLTHELANSLIASEPQPVVFDDPKKVLDQLYDELVKPQVPWIGKELMLDIVGALRERRT